MLLLFLIEIYYLLRCRGDRSGGFQKMMIFMLGAVGVGDVKYLLYGYFVSTLYLHNVGININ